MPSNYPPSRNPESPHAHCRRAGPKKKEGDIALFWRGHLTPGRAVISRTNGCGKWGLITRPGSRVRPDDGPDRGSSSTYTLSYPPTSLRAGPPALGQLSRPATITNPAQPSLPLSAPPAQPSPPSQPALALTKWARAISSALESQPAARRAQQRRLVGGRRTRTAKRTSAQAKKTSVQGHPRLPGRNFAVGCAPLGMSRAAACDALAALREKESTAVRGLYRPVAGDKPVSAANSVATSRTKQGFCNRPSPPAASTRAAGAAPRRSADHLSPKDSRRLINEHIVTLVKYLSSHSAATSALFPPPAGPITWQTPRSPSRIETTILLISTERRSPSPAFRHPQA